MCPDDDERHAPDFPLAGPSRPDGRGVRTASIRVDAGAECGPLVPIWASIGYDEINWTYTATGKRLLATLSESSSVPFHVRPHNIFTSGSGFGLPHWGSGNVYHETGDGEPFYDFSIADQTYDAIVDAGHHVLVELGFTPHALLPEHAAELTLPPSPSVYSAYEAGQWAYPPRDAERWSGLVRALAEHVRGRYGEDEVSLWLWELWNEPDMFYWQGTDEEFHRLYAITVEAIRSVLPNARVGGPAVTGGPGGNAFLRGFLDYADAHDLPLDFVSFHTKGSEFTPWRTYGPIGEPAAQKQSPIMTKMLWEIRAQLRTIAEYPRFAAVEAIVDECDAGVPAHWGFFDNANFRFQNTEYYPAFQTALMKKILDLNSSEDVQVRQATTWSFYFEGERLFEGTRAFLTAGGIEKPLLNAYRIFGRLGDTRLAARSDAAWNIDELDVTAPESAPEEIDVLASIDSRSGEITVVVYRHIDDQYCDDGSQADVDVRVDNLPAPSYRLQHHRVDQAHSNAHTVWQALGSPQDPSIEQLARMRDRQGLEEYEEPRNVIGTDGAVEVSLRLPIEAVSLLTFTPARTSGDTCWGGHGKPGEFRRSRRPTNFGDGLPSR